MTKGGSLFIHSFPYLEVTVARGIVHDEDELLGAGDQLGQLILEHFHPVNLFTGHRVAFQRACDRE